MDFEIRSNEFRQALERATREGLRRAAVFAVAECQAALSTVNPGQRQRYKTKLTKGGNRATHTVYGTPSTPGEPPRQRTGWGKGHVGFQELVLEDGSPAVRVGVPNAAIYLGYHEAGISYAHAGKQQRPWLVSTIEKYREVLARLFTAGGGA